ncbi:MAG: IS110 family transposase [Gemmatimonadales bacterium]|nr:IS110 family transposase [Gemmatimonadales bacterium]
MFYSGIDQHKASSVITTLTADGERVAQATVPNERLLLRQYFAQFPGPHKAVVESTGRWYWLRDLLVPAGVELELAHAKLLRLISGAKVKTDANDADRLAQLLRVGLIPHAHMIGDTLRGPRDVLRARLELVTRRARCEHSVGGMLEKFNVPDVGQLPPLYQLQARLQAAQIDLLDVQVKELEHAIQGQLLDDAAVQRLLWIPGIGRLLAFTLYLEIDDIQRFPTVKHFWSYCRLVPGADDSGGRHRHKTSRDGNRYLKLAFSHAAIRAVQYFPEVRQWFQRWKRKKPVRVARALVAKELAKSVYVVLKDGVDFDQQFKGTPLTKRKQASWPRRASPSV